MLFPIIPEFLYITNRNCNVLGIGSGRLLERNRVFYIGLTEQSGVAIVVDEVSDLECVSRRCL